MPEIGEVARIVNRLCRHLVGKTISKVHAVEDVVVFKDTTHEEFIQLMTGKKVIAGTFCIYSYPQVPKYLAYHPDSTAMGEILLVCDACYAVKAYSVLQRSANSYRLVMNAPPHPVMHFGMTGWIHIKKDPSADYRSTTVKTDWPPKFLKFRFEVKEDDNEFAFVDGRRLGRVRLVNAPGDEIRSTEPVASNGPDPVQEDISQDWLFGKLSRRSTPVKVFLLDQAMLSGIGNWVADEILFNSRIHPETYTNTLSESQMAALFNSINYVTKIAVETEAESENLPQDWLMLHRWGKGKKNQSMLPSGDRIDFLKVGGRTSAFVPALQKKGANDTTADAEEATKKATRARKGEKAAEAEEVKTGSEAEEEGHKSEEEDQKPPHARKKRVKEAVDGETGVVSKRLKTITKATGAGGERTSRRRKQ